MARDDRSGDPHDELSGGYPTPVASMVESIIGCKWSVRLLQLCAEEHHRPSAFLRSCPGLSSKVMNERLRKLTHFGILTRTVCGEKPPVEVEYRLTTFGRRFMQVIEEVRRLQEALDDGVLQVAGNADERDGAEVRQATEGAARRR